MDVYSGGQPSDGPNRVGSTRHDHGNAADVTFRQNGRVLDWNNPADLPILSDIVSQARANGVTGIGAGDDYMGAGRFHVGFGNPAVWGAGGKSANAPEWLRLAYNSASPRQSTALNAINTATSPLMRSAAPPKRARSFFSPLANLMAGIPKPGISVPALAPQVRQAAIGAILGSVAGRTALFEPGLKQAFTGSPLGAQNTQAVQAYRDQGLSPSQSYDAANRASVERAISGASNSDQARRLNERLGNF